MAQDDDIRVRIAGDLADIRKDLQRLRSEVKGSGVEAQRASKGWRSLSQQMSGIQRVAGRLGIGLAGLFGVRSIINFQKSIIKAADSLRELRARLENLGTGEQTFAALFTTAQETGTAIEDVTDIFARFQLGARDVGITTDQVTLLTENLIKLGRIGGASTQELTSGLIQLSQGFASGRLGGEELRAVLESLPAVAQALAKALGRSVGQLRDMGARGELTADSIAKINELTEEIDEIFRNLPVTFERATQRLENEWTLLLAAMDKALGNSEFFRFITEGLEESIRNFRTRFGDFAGFSLEDIREELRKTQEEIDRRKRGFFAGFEGQGFGREIGDTFNLDTDVRPLEELERRLEDLRAAESILIRASLEEKLKAEREAGRAAETAQVDRLKLFESASEAIVKTLKAQNDASVAALEDQLKRNLISFRDYYQRRAELAEGQIDAEIQAERAKLSVIERELGKANLKDTERTKLLDQQRATLAQIQVLEARRGEVGAEAARDLAEAERKLGEERAKVQAQLLAGQGQEAAARRAELEAQFQDLIARLQAEGDTAGVDLVRRLIDVETAKARIDEIKATFDQALAEMGRQEQSIQTQVQTGVISESEGRRRVNELYRATAERLSEIIPLAREMAAATGDPAVIERIKAMEAEIGKLEGTADEVATTLRVTFRDAGEEGFASWIRGTESLQDAFDNLINSMLDSLARLAGQQIFQSIFGGLPFFQSAGVAHGGGVVGAGGAHRKIPALTLATAPRLHGGGLLADERATILQTGEEVLSRSDPRNRLNGGGGVALTLNQDLRGNKDPEAILTAATVAAEVTRREVKRLLKRR